jgi:hypothetical protein
MKIILNSRSDLEKAQQFISWLSRPTVDQVVVSIHWLDRAEQKRAEKLLKALLNDCGCQWGAPTFLISFALCILTVLREIDITWCTVGGAFLISACFAFIAKLLSLAWSYWRLRKWFERTVEKQNKRGRLTQEGKYECMH